MLTDLNKVVIYGSLAYDRVMDFPGRFKDNFLANKLHAINVSFAVPTLKEGFGGTAGNISYNLSLLKIKPTIIGVAGNDFSKYKVWLRSHKVVTKFIRLAQNLATASAYIITDKDDNQIAGFYYGAMSLSYQKYPKSLFKKSLIVIAPGNSKDMNQLVQVCLKHHWPFIYDPGQQITSIRPTELRLGAFNAEVFIGNDYEISLVAKKLNISEKKLINNCRVLIRTLGVKGSEIWVDGRLMRIKAVKAGKVVDPTGAGDAYRAGIVYGVLNSWSWRRTGDLASKIAARAVEKYGTQNHYFKM